VTRRWGLDVVKRKADLVDAVAERLADAAHVRRLVGSAPDEVADVLLEQARRGAERARAAAGGAWVDAADDDPYTTAALHDQHSFYRYRVAGSWAVEHGLAYAAERYSVAVVLPSEVLLALAPPDVRLPFEPEPPAIPAAPVALPRLAESAGGAVTEFLGAAMAVLELAARKPLAVLRSGGVGAREVQRVAKAVGASTDVVRLALECAAARDLVVVRQDGLAPSDRFAAWRTESPARRADELVQAWWTLATIPTLERDAEGRARPALTPLEGVGEPQAIRVMMLARVGDLPDGTGVAAVEALEDYVRWRLPLVAERWSPEYVRRTWAEAEQLGVVADGACTDLGRALLEPDGRPLVDVLTGVLPAVQTRALVGSDLTVVVPGSPDPRMVDVLDAVAVRETRGAASTWRITAASVREALDAGYTADGVLAALEAIAGRIPQALDYLVRDVGRRHGHLRVRAAAVVVVSDDEALLAEVAVHRSLRRLGLQRVAPTVLVATGAVPDVLAALRSAGYLPVEVSDEGAPVVGLRRFAAVGGEDAGAEATPGDGGADPTPHGGTPHAGTDPTDERTLAESLAEMHRTLARLRSGTDGPVVPPDPDTPETAALRLALRGEATPSADVTLMERRLRERGLRLSPAEVGQVAHAVVHGVPVRIRYRSSSGGVTVRVVSQLALTDASLWGWCHLREDMRSFTLSRVLAVSAVPGPGTAT
jgi:hypothetical protein